MTMMGGPIDARKCPTAVNNLATEKSHTWFENNVIFRVPQNVPGAGRRVYPGFLQHTGFVAMNPDRHVSSHYDYFRDLIKGDDDSTEAHRRFYDEYNAVLDMPAEYYLDTIKTVFQDFALVKGTWVVRGEPVRPQDIQGTALLTIEGELDDISGAGQTRAAHDLCTGVPKERQFHYDAVGAGHYGIFSGRRWREKVYPEVKSFIARFNAEATSAAAAAAADPEAEAPAPAAARKMAKPVLVSPAPPVARATADAVSADVAPAKPAAVVAAPARPAAAVKPRVVKAKVAAEKPAAVAAELAAEAAPAKTARKTSATRSLPRRRAASARS
jgi:poly(3-hydroxybutyrate) depolymerase